MRDAKETVLEGRERMGNTYGRLSLVGIGFPELRVVTNEEEEEEEES